LGFNFDEDGHYSCVDVPAVASQSAHPQRTGFEAEITEIAKFFFDFSTPGEDRRAIQLSEGGSARMACNFIFPPRIVRAADPIALGPRRSVAWPLPFYTADPFLIPR